MTGCESDSFHLFIFSIIKLLNNIISNKICAFVASDAKKLYMAKFMFNNNAIKSGIF